MKFLKFEDEVGRKLIIKNFDLLISTEMIITVITWQKIREVT